MLTISTVPRSDTDATGCAAPRCAAALPVFYWRCQTFGAFMPRQGALGRDCNIHHRDRERCRTDLRNRLADPPFAAVGPPGRRREADRVRLRPGQSGRERSRHPALFAGISVVAAGDRADCAVALSRPALAGP